MCCVAGVEVLAVEITVLQVNLVVSHRCYRRDFSGPGVLDDVVVGDVVIPSILKRVVCFAGVFVVNVAVL